MLYTGKGNKFIFWVLIPILFTSYIGLRFIEWYSLTGKNRNVIAEKHLSNVSALDNLNCIVIGGSNAIFGISAEQISNQMNLKCYNLSLSSEGFSDGAYWEFIENSLKEKNREITHVFYSSLRPLNKAVNLIERKANRDNGVGIDGNEGFQLIGRSVASYIKQFFTDGEINFDDHKYPNPNKWGDFVFDGYDQCNSTNLVSNLRPIQDLPLLSAWTSSQLSQMTSQFPNAAIYFILPSIFRNKNFDNVTFERVVDTLEEVIKDSDIQTQKVTLINQPPFDEERLLCDAGHHANENGRYVRTINLINNIP